MESPAVHPNLARISYLLGTWKGNGKGKYPTITDFEYGEEIKFWHNGKPFLFYSQKTWNLKTGAPMHAESGFIRTPSVDKAEIILAQPTGVASIEVCEIPENGQKLAFESKDIVRAPSAKHPWVKEFTRIFQYSPDKEELEYKFSMSTETTPQVEHHLSASLKKMSS